MKTLSSVAGATASRDACADPGYAARIPYNDENYEHRREWIERRIRALAGIFAVGIHSYAVMSNHCHVVIRVEPELTYNWTELEVAERGVALHCPAKFSEEARQNRIAAWSLNPDKHADLRVKLGSLSSFTQALNQPIAIAANKEDGCTGKFWEGRYKCQRLEDESALLSAMTPEPGRLVRSSNAFRQEWQDRRRRATDSRCDGEPMGSPFRRSRQ